MKRLALPRTILIAFLALAGAGVANAEINTCIDSAGRVTLTDTDCVNASEAQPPTVLDKEPVVAGRVAPEAAAVRVISISTGAAPPMRHDTFVPKNVSKRGLAVDVATLKAAVATMHLLDGASAAMRQQRVAGR